MGPLRSIRVRLTLWYVLLLAITLAAFSGGVYFALRHNLYRNLDDSLESRAGIIAGLVAQEGRLDVSGLAIPGDPGEGEEFVRVFDASGRVVYDNSGERFRPDGDPGAARAALSGRESRRGIEASGVDLRVMTVPVRADGEIVGAVEVGLSEDDVRDTLGTLLLVIGAAYPLVLLVTIAGGVFLAGRALGPIDRLTRVARRISAEDLSQRLDMRLPDDEVGRLARTFDEMIQRLEDAFHRQRQFTADASHELRTPLTAMKGQIEVALQRERGASAYREILQRVNTEVDRMIRLVGSLMTLARADAAQIPVHRERVSVEGVVNDAMDQVRPAASAKGVRLSVSAGEDLRLYADQDLVLQLLLNLLDNAVKFTPPSGTVEVSWRDVDGQTEIAVSDTGAGIPAEHLPRVFDRFYRADHARTRAEGGTGLGLAICRWIAEAHAGTIRAESSPGRGSRFTVSLPAR